jgi:hypothetical protein
MSTTPPASCHAAGLTLSPDNSKLYAVLQDPLQQEGNETGVFSRNVRIVRFDVETGDADAQYIYQVSAWFSATAPWWNGSQKEQYSGQGTCVGLWEAM